MLHFILKAESHSVWNFTLSCPGDRYVSCYDELWDLSQYGYATISNGYYTYAAGDPSVSYHLNSCNTGYITRTWMVEDYNWNWHTCTQTIYVSSNGQGSPSIDWPRDTTLIGCSPDYKPQTLGDGYDYPTWNGNECSMYGRSYSDMVFTTTSSQCKKVMRTWKVMDWCTNYPYEGHGMYTHVQIIKIISNTPPDFECPKDITVTSNNCINAEVLAPALNISQSSCGGYFSVSNNSKYAIQKGSNISGTYPVGTTKVTYTVQYGCGLIKTCSFNVIVKGGKPVPYCTGEIVTALMGVDTDFDGAVDNGMVELWAKDLNRGSYSKCVGGALRFSFSSDVNDMKRTFTCDDLGENQVKMWVTDATGEQSYCITTVTIQNNGANIPDCHRKVEEPEKPKYVITGKVLAINDVPMPDAEVLLTYDNPQFVYNISYDTTKVLELDSFINASGHLLYRYLEVNKVTEHKDSTSQNLDRSTKTNAGGNYTFDSLSVIDAPMTLSASFKGDKSKNLNIADVEMLRNYLDGSLAYQSYYQYLASDINEDGIINQSDLDALESFVYGNTSGLPGKHQWYLIPKNTAFSDPSDVLNYDDWASSYHLDSVKVHNNAYHFIAIKKGDISIEPGSTPSQELRTRSSNNSIQENVLFYPNPVDQILHVKTNARQEISTNIDIYNQQGQRIFAAPIFDNDYQISTTSWMPGLYLCRVTQGERTVTTKILKN